VRIAEGFRKAIDSFRFKVGGEACHIAASIGIMPIRSVVGYLGLAQLAKGWFYRRFAPR